MGLSRAPHVAWRRVGDETVLIHLKEKRIYVLNPSGGFFWHRLDGARDAEQILKDVSLDAPLPETAPDNLDTFLNALSEAGLVVLDAESREMSRAETGKESEEYPSPVFVPPELVWEEQLRNFGMSCAFMSGASPACDAAPSG